MGYARYQFSDGVQRGYAVDDVCNHPECSKPIDRGMAYLCYGCTGYFCAMHLLWTGAEMECFAGESGQCCATCLKQANKEKALDGTVVR